MNNEYDVCCMFLVCGLSWHIVYGLRYFNSNRFIQSIYHTLNNNVLLLFSSRSVLSSFGVADSATEKLAPINCVYAALCSNI